MIDGKVKENLLKRLRRIGGQVSGLQRMLEEERDCVDILLQISAVQGALSQASKLLLRQHLEICVAGVLEAGNDEERREKISELADIFDRFGR